MSWPNRQRGRAAPKLPSPSGLGKMNTELLSLSLPQSLAGGFDTQPPREIIAYSSHIPRDVLLSKNSVCMPTWARMVGREKEADRKTDQSLGNECFVHTSPDPRNLG